MSDQNTQTESGTPGNSTVVNGGGTDTGSGSTATNWQAGLLDGDNRRVVETKGWKSPDDAVRSYRELEGRLGSALTVPGENAPQEEWDALWSKLGKPKDATGYELKLPEGIPPDFPYDDKFATDFKNWALEAGLPAKQARVLHDKYVQHLHGELAARQEQTKQSALKAHNELQTDWGADYERNVALTDRAVRQLGGSELLTELKSIGALGPNGEVLAPKVVKALAKVGAELFAEDHLYGGPGGQKNPFLKGSPDYNETEQGKLVRSNPELAKSLMRAAGIDPSMFRL